jgi:hypothetical protein
MLLPSKVFISLTNSVNCLAVDVLTESFDDSQSSVILLMTSFCVLSELVLSKTCSNANVVLSPTETE